MPGNDFPQEAHQPDDGGQRAIDWAAVWDEHAPRIRRIIERRAGSAAADDLLQETFERALRGQSRFDAGRPIAPWLNTIAFRLTSDVRRRRLASHEMLVDEYPELFGSDDPDESYIASLRRMGIREAFASLNPRHRRVLHLIAIEGMTSEEVAEFEHMSTQAVKSQLARARVNFRANYAAFVERLGLLAGFGALGPAMMRLRARFQRFAELATNHAGAITVAAVTTAVVGVAALPATKPEPTRAVTRAEFGSVATVDSPEGPRIDTTMSTDGELTTKTDGASSNGSTHGGEDVEGPPPVTAQTTAGRDGAGARAQFSGSETAGGTNTRTYAGIEVANCNANVGTTAECAVIDVLAAVTPGR